MKKIVSIIFLIAAFCCVKLTPTFFNSVQASEQNEIYVNNFSNKHQLNLSNLKKIAITHEGVYFLNDNLNFYNFNNTTKDSLNFTDVTDIKQTENYVIIKSQNKLIILKDLAVVEISELDIECDIFNAYEYENHLYIGYMLSNQMSVVKINLSDNTYNVIKSQTMRSSTYIYMAIAINESFTYIIFKQNIGGENKEALYKIDNTIANYNLEEEANYNLIGSTGLEIIESNGANLFLITCNNNQALTLLPENEGEEHTIIAKSTKNNSFSLGEISKVTDLKVFNGYVYIADSANFSIQQFELDKSNISLKPYNVVIASACYNLGYFNQVNDFDVINNNILLVSDTLNDRLQIINNLDDTAIVIQEYNNTKLNVPKFFSSSNFTYFWLYSNNNIIGFENASQNILTNNIIDVGEKVSDMKVLNNQPYYLNYNGNQLLKINNLEIELVFNLDFDINENSKLLILNEENFVITCDNIIYLYNLEGDLLNFIELESTITSISSDYYENIYALTLNSTFYKISYDNLLKIEKSFYNEQFSKLTSIQINKENGEIFSYDKVNNKIIKIFIENFVDTLEDFENIVNPRSATLSTSIIKSGTVINECYLSKYPHNTIKSNYLNKNQNVFILGEVENYYYILFNENNKISYGYILKENLNITEYQITKATAMQIINKNTKFYKYPTVLKDNVGNFAVATANFKAIINIVNLDIISIDNSSYYAVLNNSGQICYINASNVALYDSEDITPLPQLNAEILTTAKYKVKLLKSAHEEAGILMELSNKQKIYVENFDVSKEFTYVTIVTDEKLKVSGYVETKYIKLINNTPSLASAFIILSISAFVIIVAVIIFIKLNKKV